MTFPPLPSDLPDRHPEAEARLARLAEALDLGTAALFAGRVAPLYDSLVGDEPVEAAQLLRLADRLRATLIAITPDAEFSARLRQELAEAPLPQATLAVRWRSLPTRYRLAAGVGGLTLTLGLALLASQRVLEALGRARGAEREAGLTLNSAT